MEGKEFYRICIRQVGEVVRQVRPEQLTDETPDDEWSVRDLLNHIMYEISWVPDMVSSRTIAEVGDAYEGDLLAASNDDIMAAWELAADRAESAVDSCDPQATAHLSYMDTTADTYLQLTGGDILVHGWDLAKAIGVPYTMDEQVAEQMWQGVKDQDMSGGNLFKPELSYKESDSAQDKIIAKFGRDKNWQPQNG